MQTLDRIFNPCTPLEKARERLLQLALRDVPKDYRHYKRLRSLVREGIKDAFRTAEEKERFTYESVLCVKLIIRFIDRAYVEECHGQLMLYALRHYETENGESLMELPRIEACAKQSARQRRLLQNALGVVAVAWSVICDGTFALQTQPDRANAGPQYPDLT